MKTESELRAELARLLDAPTERNRAKIVALVWVLNRGCTWQMAHEIAAKLLLAAIRQREAADAERTPLQAFLDNLMSDDPMIRD